jgi:RNA polymerase sigma factor (sigma-70 family)
VDRGAAGPRARNDGGDDTSAFARGKFVRGRTPALPSGSVDEVGVVEELAESVFRRHYAQIYRFVRRRTVSDEQAEDITQDVFVNVAAASRRLKPDRPLLLGWLHQVARRRLADEVRRELRRPSNVLPLEAVDDVAARDTMRALMLGAALREAIGRLPRGQRDVVVLKLLQGRSFTEIAERLDASPAACKMRLVRALEALRDELEKEGITP